jgi:2,4-dienoyl-CoA reductase-like NADH-dependent reductase (Old Yellow Enzyme family)
VEAQEPPRRNDARGAHSTSARRSVVSASASRIPLKDAAFARLLAPAQLGSLAVRNRTVMSSLFTRLCARDGTPTPALVDYLVARAVGEVGLIMTEAAGVTDEGALDEGALAVHDDRFIAGLAALADAVQRHGARIGMQLNHAGPQRTTPGARLVAASNVGWERLRVATGAVPEPLTGEEIAAIVDAFGDAARRAKAAGFDLVEIHAAHGYLLGSFLSPRTNLRADRYGGSAEGRARVLREVVRRVRRAVGAEFPLSV